MDDRLAGRARHLRGQTTWRMRTPGNSIAPIRNTMRSASRTRHGRCSTRGPNSGVLRSRSSNRAERAHMAEPLDLIVIGTGSAGSGPAYRCRRAGWRVAVVDELPYGGTCALRGRGPKKVVVGAPEPADLHPPKHGRRLHCGAPIPRAHAFRVQT